MLADVLLCLTTKKWKQVEEAEEVEGEELTSSRWRHHFHQPIDCIRLKERFSLTFKVEFKVVEGLWEQICGILGDYGVHLTFKVEVKVKLGLSKSIWSIFSRFLTYLTLTVEFKVANLRDFRGFIAILWPSRSSSRSCKVCGSKFAGFWGSFDLQRRVQGRSEVKLSRENQIWRIFDVSLTFRVDFKVKSRVSRSSGQPFRNNWINLNSFKRR